MPERRAVRHLDFATLALINREVVSLTHEKHEYDESDEKRLKALVEEVKRQRAGRKTFEATIIEEASMLMFRIATGQYFHEGNKRTSLVGGLAFLNMNGYAIDIRDKELVRVIDRAGIAAASFNEVHDLIKRLIRNVAK